MYRNDYRQLHFLTTVVLGLSVLFVYVIVFLILVINITINSVINEVLKAKSFLINWQLIRVNMVFNTKTMVCIEPS